MAATRKVVVSDDMDVVIGAAEMLLDDEESVWLTITVIEVNQPSVSVSLEIMGVAGSHPGTAFVYSDELEVVKGKDVHSKSAAT